MIADRKKGNIKKGRKYEKLAAKFLEDNGYRIIELNWQAGHKEIDIIAAKDKTVVFIEVKSSRTDEYGHPSERLDRRKQENLIMAAQKFINDKNLQGYDYRFDLITFFEGKLEHYPDAFRVE